MLLQRCTHSICRVHFNSSVTPSVAFICSMIVSNRFCACSFRSARYVNNSPVSINVFNLAGWTSLKYSRCIRPYFPIGRLLGFDSMDYNVNELDTENPDVEILNEWYFKTMHHEFAHILHQTKDYPIEYNEITVGKYTGPSWTNLTEEEALELGFISNYASTEPQEDFVEMIANYVTHNAQWWRERMDMAGDGKEALQQKLELVKEYLDLSWNISLDELRTIVQRRSAEISSLDLSSLK